MTTVARGDGRPAGPSTAGATTRDAAVECTGLTYRFGDHVAVDGVDLEIRHGETFGLLGPNGAGKTTTIRMLTTLLKPAAGRVCVFGVDAAARPMLVRRMIGYVPQLLSADGTLTGRENVQLFARLFDVPRAERAARVAGALAAMGLTDAADRMANTYSGGMIRRLELAQALVNAPRLLVLDEPTVGLDPIARTDVWEFITNLRETLDMTVLMTTHYMDEADTYCDRVALMHQGTIRAEGTPAELKAALGSEASLSMTIAGIALKRDRLMGIGQAITMPLFFSSSALYPTEVMPGWLQAISKVNPLTYEVEALRALLIGTSTVLWLDFVVLAGATVAGITASSLLLPRLAR